MVGNGRTRKLSRRLVAAAAVALLGCAGCSRKPDFRTVVLITIDTLRADHVGAYGYPRPTTPFLDTLAARAVVFENAYSSSSHTAPSHASLFTSLYPEAHGVLRNGARLSPGRFSTLADVLSEQEFETAAFTSVRFLKDISEGFDHVDTPSFQPGKKTFRRAEVTTSAAVEWLQERTEGTRAFLWVHLFDVHRHGKREGPHVEFLPRIHTYMAKNSDAFERYLEGAHRRGRMSRRIKRHMLHYDAQLAYADSEIGRLFQAVEKRRAGATLWVITSDHGEGLGDHGYLGHGRHLYNEQLRVPLIVYASAPIWSPSRVDHLVRTVDLYPTILELANAQSVNQAIEGVSLVPLLSSPKAAVPIEYVFAQRRPIDDTRAERGWSSELVLAAQNLGEKYIYRPTRPDEYFDLTSDPNELRNLAELELPEAERLKQWLLDRFHQMQEQRPDTDDEIQPEHLEELRALGYIN